MQVSTYEIYKIDCQLKNIHFKYCMNDKSVKIVATLKTKKGECEVSEGLCFTSKDKIKTYTIDNHFHCREKIKQSKIFPESLFIDGWDDDYKIDIVEEIFKKLDKWLKNKPDEKILECYKLMKII